VLSDVEKGNNLILTRLTPVATLLGDIRPKGYRWQAPERWLESSEAPYAKLVIESYAKTCCDLTEGVFRVDAIITCQLSHAEIDCSRLSFPNRFRSRETYNLDNSIWMGNLVKSPNVKTTAKQGVSCVLHKNEKFLPSSCTVCRCDDETEAVTKKCRQRVKFKSSNN